MRPAPETRQEAGGRTSASGETEVPERSAWSSLEELGVHGRSKSKVGGQEVGAVQHKVGSKEQRGRRGGGRAKRWWPRRR